MTKLEFNAALRDIALNPGVSVRVRQIATVMLRTEAPKISDAEWHDWLINMDAILDAEENELIESGEIELTPLEMAAYRVEQLLNQPNEMLAVIAKIGAGVDISDDDYGVLVELEAKSKTLLNELDAHEKQETVGIN